jgi:hypothetical protein
MAARRGQTPRASLRPVPSDRSLTRFCLPTPYTWPSRSKSVILLVEHVQFLSLNSSILARYAWIAPVSNFYPSLLRFLSSEPSSPSRS